MTVSHLYRVAQRSLLLTILSVGLLACTRAYADPSGPPENPNPPEHPEPPEPPEPPGPTRRILFIGNSLTYSNDLPGMVQALASAGGRGELDVESVAFGGWSLEEHWNEGPVRDLLATQAWDFVVLQQGPSGAPASRVHLIQHAQLFEAPIRGAGARPAVFMVWSESNRVTAYDSVANNYTAAADAIGAMLFPGVRTWQAIWTRNPSLALYSDGLHPTPLGTYAIAVLMVHQITGRRAVGLPASLRTASGVSFSTSAATARLVQEAAEEAAHNHGRP